MNVANILATGTTSVDLSAMSGGKTAATDQGVLGAMFALQMENALGQPAIADLLPELKGEGDLSNLQDLLAMLQMMFAGPTLQGQQPEPVAEQANQMTTPAIQTDVNAVLSSLIAVQAGTTPQIETSTLPTSTTQQAVSTEKLNSLQNFLSKLLPEKFNTLALDNESIKPVIATFMQQGLSQQEATQFVQSLVQFAKAGEQSKQPEVHAAAEQISQLMTQLGVKTADGKELNTKKTNPSFDLLFKQFSVKQPQVQLNQVQTAQTVQTNLNLLKVNKGLSSYQVETGLVTRAQVNTSNQPVVNTQLLTVNSDSELGDETVAANAAQLQTAAPTITTRVIPAEQPVSTYTVKADQFANQVSDVFVKQMKVGTLNGLTEAKIILHPQSLGQVDVKITSHNGMITAQFSVDSRMGKEVLDSQLSQLRVALTQQGLQVDRLEVTHQQSQEQQFSFQQQKDQSRQQSFTRQQQNQQSQQGEAKFSIEQHVEGDTSTAALWNRARMAGYVNYSA